jgi:hypothetical protein
MPDRDPLKVETMLIAAPQGFGATELRIKSANEEFNISFFNLMQTYIDLIENLRLIPTNGLKILHSYRSGVLDLNYQYPNYDLGDREYGTALVKFANSCICFNLAKLISIVMNSIERDSSMIGLKSFLSPEMIKQMHRMMTFIPMVNHDRNDTLMELARSSFIQASEHVDTHDTNTMLFKFFEYTKKTIFSSTNYKREYLYLFKTYFYIACAAYDIYPNELAQLRRRPEAKTAVKILDTTLAAIPFSPQMINTCMDSKHTSSNEAIIFMHSLEKSYESMGNMMFNFPTIESRE